MADSGFDLVSSIRIADAARQRDQPIAGNVVGSLRHNGDELVAIERIDGGVVDACWNQVLGADKNRALKRTASNTNPSSSRKRPEVGKS